jgi:hypothetical protein
MHQRFGQIKIVEAGLVPVHRNGELRRVPGLGVVDGNRFLRLILRPI